MSVEPIISFDKASFSYGAGASSVENLSFEILSGEFVALIGANGAGKSTTSKMMNGLIRPQSGSVRIAGRDTAKARISELARHVGYLFQNPDRQICQQTIAREIAFGLEVLGFEKQETESRTASMCSAMGLDPDASPFTLSRGERQRVALASILAAEPEILVLDEPTTGLDARESRRVMEIVSRLNRERKTTVFIVSHDMDIVSAYARRAVVLADGRLIADVSVDEVFKDRKVLEQASLVPPQIHELSNRLAADYPELADIVDSEAMSRAVIALCSGGESLEESA